MGHRLCSPKRGESDQAVGPTIHFQQKLSSIDAIAYLKILISHCGEGLLIYFLLLISPQTLDFINYAHDTNLSENE